MTEYWPRRLLDVRQKRSVVQEKHGAIDCHAARPVYVTISYTWARFQLPGKASLLVHDIPWKIPSIDPAHFTHDQLRRVLESITALSQVEFVWLDVACMDIGHLNDRDPEIPRQKSIFAGANYGFIWLSRSTPDVLRGAASLLEQASECVSHGGVNDALAQRAGGMLVQILADPWFSSMWTLIEASVKPHSVLLSSAGTAADISAAGIPPLNRTSAVEINSGRLNLFKAKVPPRTIGTESHRPKPLPSGRYLTLWDLWWIADAALGRLCAKPVTPDRGLADALKRSGLLSMVSSNRLYLYQNIWQRDEMRPGDRIVLIKSQILEVQGVHPVDEVALGTVFALQYPVLSQLYVRTARESVESSWILTRHCRIPDLEVYHKCFGPWQAMYEIKRQTNANSQLQFTGFVANLDPLSKKWTQPTTPNESTLIGIACDESEVVRRDGTRARVTHMEALPTRCTYHGASTLKWEVSMLSRARCLSQISGEMAGENCRVLLLAYTPGSSQGLAVGAVVVQCSGVEAESLRPWTRIGIVMWLCSREGIASCLAAKESVVGSVCQIDDLPWVRCLGRMI